MLLKTPYLHEHSQAYTCIHFKDPDSWRQNGNDNPGFCEHVSVVGSHAPQAGRRAHPCWPSCTLGLQAALRGCSAPRAAVASHVRGQKQEGRFQSTRTAAQSLLTPALKCWHFSQLEEGNIHSPQCFAPSAVTRVLAFSLFQWIQEKKQESENFPRSRAQGILSLHPFSIQGFLLNIHLKLLSTGERKSSIRRIKDGA